MAKLEYVNALEGALQSVERPGTFATGGKTTPFLPDLQVENVGKIGLPLCHSQAMELKSQCEQAPYGHGEDTIVDTSVRNAWQLDASRLTIGFRIQEVVTLLIPRLASDLGCQGVMIKALPYKLVLYEEGGFFLPHRDTEKAPGMFATLVVQLPAEHKGGELVVQHNGKEKTFDFSDESASDVFFAAFFADCRHELRPVTSGLRLCLIYNLVHTSSGATPSPADHRRTVARIVQAAQSWIADLDGPEKLIYVLQHEYTSAGLSFRGLKNEDRAIAEVLCLVAREVEMDVHLAIIRKHESGSAEPNSYGYGYRKRRCWFESDEDPADWSMLEVYDTSVTLDNWVGLDDAHEDIGEMSAEEDDEFIGDNSIDDVDPDEEVQECSGNEGATMERWYRQATLVLWPCANTVTLKVKALVKKGSDVAVKQLQSDLRACREQGLAADSQQWQECQETTRLLVKHFEKMERYCDRHSAATMLSNIQSCSDLWLYVAYLAVVTKSGFSSEIAGSVLRGCKHYGWPALHESLCAMLQHNTKKMLSECVSLMAALAAGGGPAVITDEQQLDTCKQLATIVYAAVIACSTEAVPVAALFKMLYVTDQSQRLQEAARYITARPEQYQVIERLQSPRKTTWTFSPQPQPQVKNSLVAAVLELNSWLGAKAQDCGTFVELLKVCITALTANTSAVIFKPVTWTVKVPYTPCCRDCQDLARFLSDPSEQVGRFKMGKSRRMHLHRLLDNSAVDASHTTERVGNPQTLVVTKTRTHLQQKREQQKKDLQVLATLHALLAARRITLTTNGAAAGDRVPVHAEPSAALTTQGGPVVVDLTAE